MVCDFIEQGGRRRRRWRERFAARPLAGVRLRARPASAIGVANQTTMLSGESLAIAEEFREGDGRGATAPRRIAEHFRTFDTICSATQERQDAVDAAAARSRST